MTKNNVYNFGAGPAMLPAEVMLQAQAEFLDWHNGLAALEIGHRTAIFMEKIVYPTLALLRELLLVPENYKILLLPGGAQTQFSLIPMNLLGQRTAADYIQTGLWSGKAVQEARKYCAVNVAASGEDSNYTDIPDFASWQLRDDAAYVHYTPNETVHGVQFDFDPDITHIPLIADMTSELFARPLDVKKFGLIYASCQKNIGPAGLTVIIVRDDLLDSAAPYTPSTLHYKSEILADSCYNTPPVYNWYLVQLVLLWIKQQGGPAIMEQKNKQKAALVYAYIDASKFYTNAVVKRYRSWMNIPFALPNAQLEQLFLTQAEANGLMQLKGHKAVGGIRASMYNAMPLVGAQQLVQFMQDFEQRYG